MPKMKNTNAKIKLDSSKYYTSGSTAPSVQPWEYPDTNKPQISPKSLPQKHPKTQDKEKTKQYLKEKAIYHLKFLFTSTIILICCIVMIMINATILERQKSIKTLNSKLKTLEEKNLILESDISEQIDLKYIEKEAKERLKMDKPAKHQIVYIDVPKSNYTIQYNTNTSNSSETEETGLINSFKNLILQIFK